MRRTGAGIALWCCGVAACGDGTGPPGALTPVRLEVNGLMPLTVAVDGRLEAWTIGEDGEYRSAGRFEMSATGAAIVQSTIADPDRIVITVEPPGDVDDVPSAAELLVGRFVSGVAELSIVRAVTGVDDLESDPGHHALFTPSNRFEDGFPSMEDAGIWLFAPIPSATKHDSHFLKLTPLRNGWIYEGWIVHEYGTPTACWISYGKFLPDGFRDANSRDDTGLGIFSGQVDYVNAMPIEVDMPGDDWVTNIHGMPVPCGLTLPFDLNGDAAGGVPSPWTHVITIEPRSERGEPALAERPFVLRPYRNAFGQGGPNEGREVGYHPEFVPSGTATIER